MNKKIVFILSLIIQTVVVLTLSTHVVFSAKLYKWVDAQGRISYQDKPPPQNSKILSEQELVKSKKEPLATEFTANKNAIDVYVTQNCTSCDAAISLLDSWGVPHNIKNIEDHRDIQNIIIEATSALRVPAVFNEGQLIRDIKTNDALKARLIDTGHIDPSATEALKPETEVETDKPN